MSYKADASRLATTQAAAAQYAGNRIDHGSVTVMVHDVKGDAFLVDFCLVKTTGTDRIGELKINVIKGKIKANFHLINNEDKTVERFYKRITCVRDVVGVIDEIAATLEDEWNGDKTLPKCLPTWGVILLVVAFIAGAYRWAHY